MNQPTDQNPGSASCRCLDLLEIHLHARILAYPGIADDPILTGPMIPHPEAMVSNPEDRSPKDQLYPAREYLGF